MIERTSGKQPEAAVANPERFFIFDQAETLL